MEFVSTKLMSNHSNSVSTEPTSKERGAGKGEDCLVNIRAWSEGCGQSCRNQMRAADIHGVLNQESVCVYTGIKNNFKSPLL